jgi:oxygen-independent coproporphyrinogen-3 oxidase
MYEATIDQLAAAGFQHYEISNFARPQRACRHNLVYWHNAPCLGIGPSAAGFDGRVRYRNIPDTAAYVAAVRDGRSPRIEHEELTAEQRARETAMLELRLIGGIDRPGFRARFGHDPLSLFASPIAKFAPPGLLEVDARAVRLTRKGLLVADSVMAEFL